jgi:endonuclease YncB( thermonuclease family)
MKIRSRLSSLALAVIFGLGCFYTPLDATAAMSAVKGDYSGLVVGISDGDTISVLHGGQPEKVRLSDIDCPEKKQAFGERAKQFTALATFNKTVRVKVTGKDKYGRSLAEVVLPNQQSLNRQLLKEGLAWVYLNRSKDPLKHAAQQQAQTARRGLWSEKESTPPWQWRKELRVKSVSARRD